MSLVQLLDRKVDIPVLCEDSSDTWQFNDEVAARFDREARTHIPDYEHVIRLCLAEALRKYDTQTTRVVDVGSATGYTLEQFRNAGFQEVVGVENSPAMIKQSRMRERVIFSDTFPRERVFDLVLANWTLHFIRDRATYIRDIYSAMRRGGTMMLTDKMTTDALTRDQYHAWKGSVGVSAAEIARKEAALAGVLTTRALEWYLETLRDVGFKDVHIVHKIYGFTTLVARK